METMIVLAAVGLVAGGAAVTASWRVALAEERVDVALDLADGAADDPYTRSLADPLAARLVAPIGRALADAVSRAMPSNWIASVRRELELAGLRRSADLDGHLAGRAVALAIGVGLGIVALVTVGGGPGVALAIIAVGLGLMLPKGRLARRRAERVADIRRQLADVLDLLAISVEAGAGLEQAMATVSERFGSAVGVELEQTLREMEIGLARREALERLKRRTEIPELNNFIVALVQADALGMPLGRVLRTQADAMRMRRRQLARETAAKLPVKMVLPLVTLILPALFIVVLGPAVISIARNLF